MCRLSFFKSRKPYVRISNQYNWYDGGVSVIDGTCDMYAQLVQTTNTCRVKVDHQKWHMKRSIILDPKGNGRHFQEPSRQGH